MTAPGETDLEAMLASLDVVRRPGTFTYVEVASAAIAAAEHAHAVVVEDDSTTLVLTVDDARRAGLPGELEMAWLTLTVESSLEAVGLTAAFARMLGDVGVPCNVLAGFRHDHVLVPVDRVDDAMSALRAGTR